MNYQKTTQVPNEIFDIHLTTLTNSELKILLYIIRQTYGWKLKNGKRKKRDRITYKQFNQKTKVSIRSIPVAIQSLITKHLINVTDFKGNLLHTPEQRKGKVCIYYTPCVQRCAEKNKEVCKKVPQPMHNRVYNKTNTTKLTRQKGRVSDFQRIQQILHSRNAQLS
jgi:phage replication O-like protein O